MATPVLTDLTELYDWPALDDTTVLGADASGMPTAVPISGMGGGGLPTGGATGQYVVIDAAGNATYALPDVYDVTDPRYGAVGDSTTDNYDRVAAAVADAMSANGGVIYFPRALGRYVIKPKIVAGANQPILGGDNIVFAGTGPHSVVQGLWNGNSNYSNCSVFHFRQNKNCGVRNLRIVGDTDATTATTRPSYDQPGIKFGDFYTTYPTVAPNAGDPTVTVNSVSTAFVAGATLSMKGAGQNGSMYIGKILSVAGNVATVDTPIGTNVASGSGTKIGIIASCSDTFVDNVIVTDCTVGCMNGGTERFDVKSFYARRIRCITGPSQGVGLWVWGGASDGSIVNVDVRDIGGLGVALDAGDPSIGGPTRKINCTNIRVARHALDHSSPGIELEGCQSSTVSNFMIDGGEVADLAATVTTTGGSLTTGTHWYMVTAFYPDSGETSGSQIGVVLSGSTNQVTLSWTHQLEATKYRVYWGFGSGNAARSNPTHYIDVAINTTIVDTGVRTAWTTPATLPTNRASYGLQLNADQTLVTANKNVLSNGRIMNIQVDPIMFKGAQNNSLDNIKATNFGNRNFATLMRYVGSTYTGAGIFDTADNLAHNITGDGSNAFYTVGIIYDATNANIKRNAMTNIKVGNPNLSVLPVTGPNVIGVGADANTIQFAGRIMQPKSANYTILSRTDEGVYMDASGGARTVTMPDAICHDGQEFVIKKMDSSANTVTVTGVSSQTFDGAANFVLSNQNDTLTVKSDGANWKIILRPSIVSIPAHATTHQPGGADPMAVDAAVGTGSLRTLGSGAQQAAPGNDVRFASQGYVTILPRHHGLLGWTIDDPAAVVNNTAPAQGICYYTKCYLPTDAPFTIGHVNWINIVAAAGTAAVNFYLGVYNSAGTRLGVTTDQSAGTTTVNAKSAALTLDAGQSLNFTPATDQYVWIGMVVGTQAGTTPFALTRGSGTGAVMNWNIASVFRFAIGSGGQSALPTSITPASLTIGGIGWLLGVST